MSRQLGEISELEHLIAAMRGHGVHTLAFKRLAENDNSKNQIYLGAGYPNLQLLPFGELTPAPGDVAGDIYKAPLDFLWLDGDGRIYRAPDAQLILYPQYPEVRLSGLLNRALRRPSAYINSRTPGRVLILGITSDRRIIAHALGPQNSLTAELAMFESGPRSGKLYFIYRDDESDANRRQLLRRLAKIYRSGPLPSIRLSADGMPQQYAAVNAGGFTFEAQFGILPNSLNEPDFLGWELKQHASGNLGRPLAGGAVTLITPEPTGGLYQLQGAATFVRRFGYPDVSGIPDRLNFGGIHKVGLVTARTGLQLALLGYDAATNRIDDMEGGLILLTADGTVAALWHFRGLLEKWNRKHAKAVYVPSSKLMIGGNPHYHYGYVAALGEGTDFGMFLRALAAGTIYYDPALKIENASNPSAPCKRRSQFRMRASQVPALYRSMELEDVRDW